MKIKINKVGCFGVRFPSEAMKKVAVQCLEETRFHQRQLKGKFVKENLWLSFIAVPQFEEIQKEPAGSF